MNIVDCGPLTTPTNGNATLINGTTYLSTATIFCNTGYDLSGSQRSTCQASGRWSNTNATCKIKSETYV